MSEKVSFFWDFKVVVKLASGWGGWRFIAGSNTSESAVLILKTYNILLMNNQILPNRLMEAFATAISANNCSLVCKASAANLIV